MLVTFNPDLPSEIVNAMSHEERKIYDMERESTLYRIATKEISSPEIRPIYGVFFFENKTLFLVCKKRNISLFSIQSSKFYKVIENSGSSYWNYFDNCQNDNMVYPETNFNEFRYMGIDRFVNEPDFFFKYHMDFPDALDYLAKTKILIEEEAERRWPEWMNRSGFSRKIS